MNSSSVKDSTKAMLAPLALYSESIPASQQVSPDSTIKPPDAPVLIPGAIFKEGEFWVVQPSRESRQFSFFSEEEEEEDQEVKLRDPGLFHARLEAKRKQRNRRRRIQGSYSHGGHRKPSKLKYAFLKPEPYQTKESKDCKPASPISAFTFLNFVLAAGSVAANIVANVNDNNNNNNNNNNENNDNTNNFNIENNSNNANNANTIMLPLGRRRRRRREVWRRSLRSFQNLVERAADDPETVAYVASLLASPHLQCVGPNQFKRGQNQTISSSLASSQLFALKEHFCQKD